jgi:hypothetical protein
VPSTISRYTRRVTAPALPFSTRLWFAWVCFFRVLFDGVFARRALLAQAPERAPELELPREPPAPPPPRTAEPEAGSALQLLALLQREGRLVDFLQQDVASFPDADIGAVARVVHSGCKKALASHLAIQPVRSEPEGGRITLEQGFDPGEIKLVGNVSGAAPYRGTLRHRGWRVASVSLPKLLAGHDPHVLAPAEVEL